MEIGSSAKQAIELQKTIFDNSYKIVSSAQEQSEKIATFFMKQSPLISKDDKQKFDDALTIYNDMRKESKDAVDSGYKKLEKLFDSKKED